MTEFSDVSCECHEDRFRLLWTAEGIGFGQIEFWVDADGCVEIFSEYMGKEFVKLALIKMVDDADLRE